MNILNILTLGILPAARMLMSKGPEDPRRGAYANFAFSRFGTPSEKDAFKVVKKFYATDAERKHAMMRLRDGMHLFFKTEEEANDFLDALEDAGFELDVEFSDVYTPPAVWAEHRKTYVSVVEYNYCNGCGKKNPRLYHDWDTQTYSCSICGSEDLIIAADLPLKEFLKHVEKFPTLSSASAGGKKRASSRGADPTVSAVEYDDED